MFILHLLTILQPLLTPGGNRPLVVLNIDSNVLLGGKLLLLVGENRGFISTLKGLFGDLELGLFGAVFTFSFGDVF